MIYYRVCYFILNSSTGEWETVKEYPLSESIVWTRVNYLAKHLHSLIWLERIKSASVCENCEHFDWYVEEGGSYCDLHRTTVPWDWSCSDFNFY